MQERLTAAQEAVRSELDVLNQGLQKRQQAAKVKALLKLMQDTAHVMSKVQNILAQDRHVFNTKQLARAVTPPVLEVAMNV